MFRAIQKAQRLESLRRQGFEDGLTGQRIGYELPGADAEEREAYRHGREKGQAAVHNLTGRKPEE